MAGLYSILALALVLGLAAQAFAADNPSVDRFYVAPNGNDHWSGRWSVPNMTDTDGPLATIEGARQAVRKLKEQGELKRPIEVWLRKGTYTLDAPFVLTAKDSGTASCSISYEAFSTASGPEDVTISGGRRITGFREVTVSGKKMIAASIPEVKAGKWNFTQLFVNSRRRPRTRLPKEGYYTITSAPDSDQWQQGQDHFKFKGNELKSSWKNLADVDVVALTLWVESRMPIRSVDESARAVKLAKPSRFWLASEFDRSKGARYYVENVFEALDTPGQWYLDRADGILYYYPHVGEDWQHAEFVAPVLERLVRVEGDARGAIENVHFRNLRFSHTEHALPADSSGSAQAAFQVPAAVHTRNTRRCSIEQCEVAHIGAYGIEVGDGCLDNSILRTSIRDMGAGGVKVWHDSQSTTVKDCEISDGGKIFLSAVGVWVGNSPHNRIEHNSIHDLYYTGVSVGWVWGYSESKAIDNHVEYNHIYNVGRGVLSDLAAVYTLGVSPGTTIAHNLIHDCQSYSYGGWGIYTDEGSSGIVIENNIVYRTKTGGFHQHYGEENTVRNNIFAFAKEQQLQRTRKEPHTSFIFERNIIYSDTGILLGTNWEEDRYKMDYNLYFDASGRPVTFAGGSFDDWKKRGHDQHSVIADPEFIDPEDYDFRLHGDSPALKLGFQPVDLKDVGPREKAGIARD